MQVLAGCHAGLATDAQCSCTSRYFVSGLKQPNGGKPCSYISSYTHRSRLAFQPDRCLLYNLLASYELASGVNLEYLTPDHD